MGTHTTINQLVVEAPTLVGGGVATVPLMRTLYLNGTPTQGTSGNWTFESTTGNILFNDASGASLYSFGTSNIPSVQFGVGGNFTAGGVSSEFITRTHPGPSSTGIGVYVGPTFDIAASGVHPNFNAVEIAAPVINSGAGSLTNASSLKIDGAPTGGQSNYAEWIAGGNVFWNAGEVTISRVAVAGNTVSYLALGSDSITASSYDITRAGSLFGFYDAPVLRAENDTGTHWGHYIHLNSVAASAHTVPNRYAEYIQASSKHSNITVNNDYSLYLEAPVSGITSNYTLYSSGGANYFGGNVILGTVSNGLVYKAGSNARVQSGTLVGGTLALSNTSVTANTKIYCQDTSSGSLANVGSLVIASKTAGTGFTVSSTNVLDTSTFDCWLHETN